MQQKDNKSKILATVIGKVIKATRENTKKCSINQIAHEYSLDVGNLSRVENGKIDVKVVTLWKISEALGIKHSDFIKLIEEYLPDNFHFYED